MTTISSATRALDFGGGQPTAVIGERINPTGKSRLTQALLTGNFDYLVHEARRQVAAGATILDVNVGAPGVDEVAALRRAVEVVSAAVDVPLCIDSSSADALAAALSVYKGKALVNSVTGEAHSLERVLPLVKAHGAAVVGITQDDTGVPCSVEDRVGIARRIVAACAKAGIPSEDVVIDCACLAVSADPTASSVTLESVRRVTHDLGVSTVLGSSNVSFGLPGRKAINAHFLGMTIGAGLSAAIVDPTVPEIMNAIFISDLLAGRDEYAQRYLPYYRANNPPKPV
jgi:5-methyltetrahydrofolate--homocysteine methyltransferase